MIRQLSIFWKLFHFSQGMRRQKLVATLDPGFWLANTTIGSQEQCIFWHRIFFSLTWDHTLSMLLVWSPWSQILFHELCVSKVTHPTETIFTGVVVGTFSCIIFKSVFSTLAWRISLCGLCAQMAVKFEYSPSFELFSLVVLALFVKNGFINLKENNSFARSFKDYRILLELGDIHIPTKWIIVIASVLVNYWEHEQCNKFLQQ